MNSNAAPIPISRSSALHGSARLRIPRVDLPLRLIAGDSVALLNPADELFTAALDLIEIIVW